MADGTTGGPKGTEKQQRQPAALRMAATVLLVRDGDASAGRQGGPERRDGPEIYMVRRHSRNAFMANATVFVGGRVDDEDADAALWQPDSRLSPAQAQARLGCDAEATARGIYTAAVRETFEESGVLLARRRDGGLVDQTREPERDALNDGKQSFAEILAALDAAPAFGELRYLARWVTPEFEPKRYDTYFFACRMPSGQQASYDQRETSAGDWYRAGDLLDAARRDEVLLAPPTLCVLEDLRDAETTDALLAGLADAPTPPVMPRPLIGSGPITLLLPDDHRYDAPQSAEGPEHYAVLSGSHWERVRR